MISIQSTNQSDSTFLGIVSSVCSAEARLLKAESINVVEIDHCFDKKWRAFSGVIAPQFATWWLPDLRVPPFHPNRVVSQTVYRRLQSPDQAYVRRDASPLHVEQSSYRDVHRLIRRIDSCAIYAWYSGQTETSDQGSILLYRISETEETSWFATLSKSPWRLARSHGISRRAFELLIESQHATAAPN